jgi:hypothetical protein
MSETQLNNVIPHSGIETFTTSPKTLIEGLTQTAYCQPIEMIDPEGSVDANLTIPLDGKYSPNNATNNVSRTAVNIMSFIIIVLFTYVITPIIYNEYIVGLIELTGQSKMNRIRSIDIYTTAVFTLATISLIGLGVKSNNPNSTIMGFFIGLFFIISFVIIQTKKIEVTWFKQTFDNNNPGLAASYDNINVSNDFFSFISGNFKIISSITNLMIGGVIFSMLLAFGYLIGVFSTNGMLSDNTGILFVFLFTIYLTIAIHSVREMNK